MNSIASIRTEYLLKELLESDVLANPILQFEIWWNEVLKSEIHEPNAMILATASASRIPSARVVLLKDFNETGFKFYTNYDSDKGKNILQNNSVALLFFWKELQRQVRVEGKASKLDASESDLYFGSRPRASRIGALTSNQSSEIESRDILEKKYTAIEQQFKNDEIPRPDNWGGYNVSPVSIEFWQGRANRLHDRLKYVKENNEWKIVRLAP